METAIATSRNESIINQLSSYNKLAYHQIDVTCFQSIKYCYTFIKMEFRKLNVLINISSYSITDVFEETPEERILAFYIFLNLKSKLWI